jgi:hypothetical protein
MKEIVGCKLNQFPLNLKFIMDLIYFDGSLLSLFENEHGDSYLYYWCDADELHNRWLVFRVAKALLKDYILGNTTLQKLILKPIDGFLYSLDIDDDLEVENTYLIQPESLPKKYIPADNSSYDLSLLNAEALDKDILVLLDKIILYDVKKLPSLISIVNEQLKMIKSSDLNYLQRDNIETSSTPYRNNKEDGIKLPIYSK